MMPIFPENLALLKAQSTLPPELACAFKGEEPHPRQPTSKFCCVHMSKAELAAFVAPGVARAMERWSSRSPGSGDMSRPRRRRRGNGQGGVAGLNKERRNGAKVKYPLGAGEYSIPCPTIWTPVSCYPYPNWRRKLGLAGSYPTSECQVVEPGWIPGQKPQKP